MGHALPRFSVGKTTYWIKKGVFFQNTSRSQLDGLIKAQTYCAENMLSTQCIVRFDSELEMKRYEYLMEQEKLGKISNLQHHFMLVFQKEFVNANGDTIPAITYNADFVYTDNETNHKVVEDVKGASMFTDTRFELMKQIGDSVLLPKNCYIRIVRQEKNEETGKQEWVEWHFGDKIKKGKLLKKQREQIKAQKAELHKQEMAENLKQREIARLKELRELKASGVKMTKPQRVRLEELEAKYTV